MCVNHTRAYIASAEEFLNRTDAIAILKEMDACRILLAQSLAFLRLASDLDRSRNYEVKVLA
jgi:hypothetical protein